MPGSVQDTKSVEQVRQSSCPHGAASVKGETDGTQVNISISTSVHCARVMVREAASKSEPNREGPTSGDRLRRAVF